MIGKKRISHFLLSLIFACLGIIQAATAQTVANVDGIRYLIQDGTAMVGRQDKELTGDIIIPESITCLDTTYSVTGMVDPTNVTRWSNNTVTCEGGAFQSCQITSITLPKTITTIPTGAFNDCTALLTVSLPEELSSIGMAAFAGCTSLTEIQIPDNVSSVQRYAFGGGTNLKTLNIPSKTTTISIGCFMNSGIEEMYVPATVTDITESSLAVKSLKTLRMGISDITKITYSLNAFSDVSSAELQVPKGSKDVYSQYEPWSNFMTITEYGDSTDTPITPDQLNVTVDGIKYILQDGEATVGRQDATLAGDIVIPSSITYNNETYPVTEIIASSDLTCYSGGSISCVGGTFQKSAITSISIPQSITTIPSGAFQNCKELIKVELPEGLTQIGAAAFAGCSSLSDITIPSTVKDLASNTDYGYRSYTFGGCGSLKSINIPTGITRLASGCFMNAGIEELTIHDKLLTLDEECLKTNSLNTLKICVKDMDDLSYMDACFGDMSNTDLIVPKGSKQVYQEYYPWMTFKSISEYDDGSEVFVPAKITTSIDGVRYILKDGKATIGRQNKEMSGDVVIPETVIYNGETFSVNDMVSPTNIIAWSSNRTTCENGAFQSCLISSVVLPNTITIIPAGAFNNCSNLVNITLPDSVTQLGAACFAGCSSLEEIYLPENINNFGSSTRYGFKSYIFGGCSNLKKVNMPKSVTTLAEGCFMNSGLETFLISNNITNLQEDCFSAGNLKSIKICHRNLDNLQYTESCFSNVGNIDLYVPKGYIELYQEFYPWKSFKSISEYEEADDDTLYNAYRIIYLVTVENNEAKAMRMASANSSDGDIYHKDYIPSGVGIATIEEPSVEGYKFIGWENLEETMPARDVVVKALFEKTTGVKDIHVDTSGKYIAYSLNGIKLLEATDLEELTAKLSKGVYIINGKKFIVK